MGRVKYDYILKVMLVDRVNILPRGAARRHYPPIRDEHVDLPQWCVCAHAGDAEYVPIT